MTRTYKVALGVAGLILAFSVVYYAAQPAPAETDAATPVEQFSLAAVDTNPSPRRDTATTPPAPLGPTPRAAEPAQTPRVPLPDDEPPVRPAPAVPTIDLTTLRASPLDDPDELSDAADPTGVEPRPARGDEADLDTSLAATDEPEPATPTALRASAEPPRPTPAAPTTYTVRRGDTLSSIAVRLYGQERRWVDIAQANPTIDPIRLRVGQTLKLPTDAQAAAPDEPEIDAPAAELRHTIQSGENLSSIAQRYYGRAARWRVLFNANRDVLGNNPNAIRAGMVITVPPLPVTND